MTASPGRTFGLSLKNPVTGIKINDGDTVYADECGILCVQVEGDGTGTDTFVTDIEINIVDGEIVLTYVDNTGAPVTGAPIPFPVPTVNSGAFGVGADYDAEILLHEGNIADGTDVDAATTSPVVKLADGSLAVSNDGNVEITNIAITNTVVNADGSTTVTYTISEEDDGDADPATHTFDVVFPAVVGINVNDGAYGVSRAATATDIFITEENIADGTATDPANATPVEKLGDGTLGVVSTVTVTYSEGDVLTYDVTLPDGETLPAGDPVPPGVVFINEENPDGTLVSEAVTCCDPAPVLVEAGDTTVNGTDVPDGFTAIVLGDGSEKLIPCVAVELVEAGDTTANGTDVPDNFVAVVLTDGSEKLIPCTITNVYGPGDVLDYDVTLPDGSTLPAGTVVPPETTFTNVENPDGTLVKESVTCCPKTAVVLNDATGFFTVTDGDGNGANVGVVDDGDNTGTVTVNGRTVDFLTNLLVNDGAYGNSRDVDPDADILLTEENVHDPATYPYPCDPEDPSRMVVKSAVDGKTYGAPVSRCVNESVAVVAPSVNGAAIDALVGTTLLTMELEVCNPDDCLTLQGRPFFRAGNWRMNHAAEPNEWQIRVTTGPGGTVPAVVHQTPNNLNVTNTSAGAHDHSFAPIIDSRNINPIAVGTCQTYTMEADFNAPLAYTSNNFNVLQGFIHYINFEGTTCLL